MRQELTVILITGIWSYGILVIALYFSSIRWGVWTWIPLGAYIIGSFGLGYKFNVARRAIQNTSGENHEGYDGKKWLNADEKSALIGKVFLEKDREERA